MEMRSTLGRVRGLGSTGDGSHHWWIQRLTAVALIPLGIWFIFAALSFVGTDYAQFKAWAGHHGNALLLVLFIITAFHHAQLGMQVVIEDYIHGEAVKITSILLIKFVSFMFAVSCILAVLRLYFGG
ncbi:MAG: succinate dehydrogenase, hydrophobic membrane anchor protein [Rhodospirillaceae bacterium]|jgi:succinate dehydrogenase / fumarate reductase membrane anchor subunit|nr:succinate dehydrogenase, hydrophobic membrane anchor protein [Rhodospirillaceae bacterium]MBT7487462.1 succinate dehydrogenase, hydrophobic membrane anchor protein [Rhodospirillales bacterium]MBT4700919.1 succinate dehydrogenase, hydrophobic membrane anchor protein [Rhodospirillaceae bacterium]MBT5033421.1 succinate dehydrogenase, hydrophobic membrane anchor protein [Rhodospirillaceae bacterium]MBT6218474.1 succinate dehydrogenase, hydrophobic membrane anchor protein [Rhodospirillaceae bacte